VQADPAVIPNRPWTLLGYLSEKLVSRLAVKLQMHFVLDLIVAQQPVTRSMRCDSFSSCERVTIVVVSEHAAMGLKLAQPTLNALQRLRFQQWRSSG
jgi:hypothetical protein